VESSFPIRGAFPSLVNATCLSRTQAPVVGLRFSRDGQFLACADASRTVRVWQNGHLIFDQNFRSWREKLRAIDIVRAFEISPGGQSIFIAAGDSVSEVQFQSNKVLWKRERKPTFGFIITCPRTIALSHSGELAMAYDDGHIDVMPCGYPGRPVRQWKDNQAPFCMAYMQDGRTLIGTDGHFICLWDSASGMRLSKLTLEQKLCNLAISDHSPIVAFRTLHRVLLFDCKSMQMISSSPVLRGLPSLSVSSDGQFVAAGDALGVSVFDRNGALVGRFPQLDARTLAITFMPNNHTLAIGSSDGSVVLWKFDGPRAIASAFMH
jgi:WD40 repeat protein